MVYEITRRQWWDEDQTIDGVGFGIQDSVTAFQTSFFSFLSLVFAIYSGNTMAFLYEVIPFPPRLSPPPLGPLHLCRFNVQQEHLMSSQF